MITYIMYPFITGLTSKTCIVSYACCRVLTAPHVNPKELHQSQVQIVGDDLLVTNPKRIGKAVEDGDDPWRVTGAWGGVGGSWCHC